jgi:hypothetical protein
MCVQKTVQVCAKVVFAVLAVVLAGYMVEIAVALPCQKPNPSTKLCAGLPAGAVTSCAGATPCSGAVYEIANFPDGAVGAETGTTKEEQAPCIRSNSCVVDTSSKPPGCKASIFWTPWSPGAKTVTGDNPCP